MMRVVPDSNVYVSALLFGGNPRRVIALGAAGSIQLCISDSIKTEVERVLRAKFHWTRERIAAGTGYLWSLTYCVDPKIRVTDCPDPDDNAVLECALEAPAEWIVTGDQHLLSMHPFQGISILQPRQFLDRKAWLP